MKSVEELRKLYRPPGQAALDKQIDRLDEHCRAHIAHSPFVMVSTADAEGRCDVSPKGGPPGFVKVVDDSRVALPDLSGNNRLDSLENLVSNPGIALLFLIPGRDETLRVNGVATITTDPDLCALAAVGDLVPRVVVLTTVEAAYIHCAKALRRAQVWDVNAWPDTTDLATGTCMMRDHAGFSQMPLDQIDALIEQNYRDTMWQAGGESR